MGSNTEKNQSTKLIQKGYQKLFRILMVAIVFSPTVHICRIKKDNEMGYNWKKGDFRKKIGYF